MKLNRSIINIDAGKKHEYFSNSDDDYGGAEVFARNNTLQTNNKHESNHENVSSSDVKPKTPQLLQLIQQLTQSQAHSQQNHLEQSDSSSINNATSISAVKHNSHHEYVSSNKVKKIRLGDEDIKELSKPTPLLNPETLRMNSVFSSNGPAPYISSIANSSSASIASQPAAYSASSSSYSASSSSSESVFSTSSSSLPSAVMPSRQISELRGLLYSIPANALFLSHTYPNLTLLLIQSDTIDLKLSGGTDYPPPLPPPPSAYSNVTDAALLKR